MIMIMTYRDEALSLHVGIENEIQWLFGLYVVSCVECDSRSGWDMYRRQIEPGLTRAWLVCGACGHEQTHPLVYPEYVDAVLEWTKRDCDPQRQPEELSTNWRPHVGVYEEPLELCTSQGQMRWYPWENSDSGTNWPKEWSGLCAAADALVEAKEAAEDDDGHDEILAEAHRRLAYKIAAGAGRR